MKRVGDIGGSIPLPGKGVPNGRPVVFSVASGKGGVGTTNTVINLAVEIQRRGQKVLVLDADLGLSNIPHLMGMTPDRDLSQSLLGAMNLKEVMVAGPEGVMILPGAVGMGELTILTEEQKLRLICETEALEEEFDIVLVDAGAGISSNAIFFNLVSRHNIILVNPEPSSLSDAYALIKILAIRYRRKRFNLILNGIRDDDEERKIYDRFSLACHRFLNVSLSYLGAIPFDDRVRKAIREKEPVVQRYPHAPSSRSFGELAEKLVHMGPCGGNEGSLRFFCANRLSPDQHDQMKRLSG